ncbi:putative sulfatase [Dyadobacter jejuensis]|uniref:Putative sulfatase n=1 Tax=Dyadobacter jejuensis TaxID=1082580 RepID=A0A316ANJ0_9BACT|nr:sulfatase-like hydrolase/transferase [Dyadobacter jejuensis]PWJ58694.1 putative sulfatase [Dyadobacter jejuensis]
MPLRKVYLVLVLCLLLAAQSHGQKRPNIIFILTDDQAAWAQGQYQGSQAITPNMDRIAQEGVYLSNAFVVTPVCSPSRASLLTSRYGYELGIDDWINEKGRSLTGIEPGLGIDAALPTWPKALAKAGYHTGLIGKWHLGSLDESHPTVLGYQEFSGFREGGTKTENPIFEIKGESQQMNGLTEDLLTDLALEFVDNHQSSPFALSLHFRAPHTNWLPVRPEDAAPFKSKNISIPEPNFPDLDTARTKSMMRDYLSSVKCVDRNLGRLLNRLDSLGLAENTILIFTSDHGYNMGHNGIWHKGNGHWLLNHPVASPNPNIPVDQRPNLYDNSLRVPAMIRWPGKIQPGTVLNHTVANIDWYPTILDMVGVTIPLQDTIRGKSFNQFLLGKSSGQRWDEDLFAVYTTKHQSKTQMRMYRTNKYKLIRDFLNPERDEFYDLESDPQEHINLIHSTDKRIIAQIKTLDKRLSQRMINNNDPLKHP